MTKQIDKQHLYKVEVCQLVCHIRRCDAYYGLAARCLNRFREARKGAFHTQQVQAWQVCFPQPCTAAADLLARPQQQASNVPMTYCYTDLSCFVDSAG